MTSQTNQGSYDFSKAELNHRLKASILIQTIEKLQEATQTLLQLYADEETLKYLSDQSPMLSRGKTIIAWHSERNSFQLGTIKNTPNYDDDLEVHVSFWDGYEDWFPCGKGVYALPR
jgi:hypothetical protein